MASSKTLAASREVEGAVLDTTAGCIAVNDVPGTKADAMPALRQRVAKVRKGAMIVRLRDY